MCKKPIDVWTEMAKEMKQNFGRHQSKSVTKPDSAMGSGGRGSGSSWGMNAIPPLTSAGHSVAIQQQISAHSAAAQEQNNLSIASPGDEDNNDSNNSSIQSNSNSEFSDINDSHGGGGHGPTICQVATVRQRSANTPTPKRNYNQQFAHHDHHLLEDEDPYGPMSSHFYTGARNRIQLRSNSVLTSPVTTSKCAYHTTNSAASTNQPNSTTTTMPLRGSSADIRHYAVKAISNRQYQSGSDLHGQG